MITMIISSLKDVLNSTVWLSIFGNDSDIFPSDICKIISFSFKNYGNEF